MHLGYTTVRVYHSLTAVLYLHFFIIEATLGVHSVPKKHSHQSGSSG